MSKRRRATEAEKLRRLDQVMTLLVQGHSPLQIIRAATEGWGLSKRQAERYLEEARAMQRARAEEDMPDHCGRLLARVQYLYGKSHQKDDLTSALRATGMELKIIIALQNSNREETEDARQLSLSDEFTRDLQDSLREPPGKGKARRPKDTG